MTQVAIIFENRVRPETTGLYCRRALGELLHTGLLTEVEHFLPDELDTIPADRFDLFLFVDDGLIESIPEHLKPSVWWAIDTHLEYERALHLARQADWTFAAQQRGAEQLRADGITNAAWLPLACDPEIHGRKQTQQQFDIAFVGHVFPGERERLLNEIQERYPRSFVGQSYLDEMATVYSSSKIVFNRSLKDDLNMRVFEGLCSGSLLVTNALPDSGQDELFQGSRHLVTYESDEDLWEKLDFYLTHEDERQRIAESGRSEVLQQHTYRHRMEAILETVLLVSEDRMPAARPAIESKSNDYFEHERSDVLALIPETATRILEIGCGGGRLGETIKQRQAARVTGIEYDPIAAQRAEQRLDEVHIGDIERNDITFTENSFDCIVCADVLEHLRDPLTVLKRVREWMTPDSVLVTSLPNVRNHTVIQSLLAGNWTYESAGLLDADHVRFFTRREIEKLLFRAGFTIDEMQMVGGEGFSEWVQSGKPQQLSIGGLQIRTGSEEEAAEFFAYQYLTRSRQSVEGSPQRSTSSWFRYGKTSIIIVTYNQLDYTRQCVDSIRLLTDEPLELIFVDNASTDGTPEYLRSLEPSDDVTVILNDTNRGFPAGVNQGLEVATGDNILLLNNDTIVTTGWLRRMLEALHSEENIGLVGPVSNSVSGPQQVETGYGHLNELDGFAWDWGHQYHGQRADIDRLVGFCLLFKREVIDQIGTLDEQFGIGNFEDDDFCRRAREAGYRCVVAVDSFVHHFGSISFKGAGVDFGGLLQENQQKYLKKWQQSGEVPSTALSHDQPPLLGTPRPQLILESTESGLKLQANTIKLSACLIVRNNEDTIRPCLDSVKPWVDEMVVVDTGSTDATPDICRELGARVFHWPWRDSFAAARNESLDHARGEWIFWLDSDDTLPEHCGRQLRELVDGNHAENVLGYVAQVHCPGTSEDDVTVVDHVKLFPNRPDLRFEFRIHEQIIPSIRRAGGEVAWSDLYVVHSGSDRTEEGRARKVERDFHLLELELADRSEHPFVLFNLGMTHADVGQYEPAVNYLQRCIRVSGADESHVRKAFALLVSSLSQADHHEEAWNTVREGLQRFPDDKELLFRQAMLQHHFGRLQDAELAYLRVLDEQTERHFTSVDTGIAGYKARHNLAIVYEEMGEDESALAQWQAIVAERPDYLPAWRGWGELLISRNFSGELSQFFRKISKKVELRGLSLYLQGKIAIANNKPNLARRNFEQAVEISPEDTIALNSLSRLLFERFSPVDAIPLLRNLIALDGGDASAWHNLGVALMENQEWEEAENCLRTSLRLRPDAAHTQSFLQNVMAQLQTSGMPVSSPEMGSTPSADSSQEHL